MGLLAPPTPSKEHGPVRAQGMEAAWTCSYVTAGVRELGVCQGSHHLASNWFKMTCGKQDPQ